LLRSCSCSTRHFGSASADSATFVSSESGSASSAIWTSGFLVSAVAPTFAGTGTLASISGVGISWLTSD
jgi:hypothetical protein